MQILLFPSGFKPLEGPVMHRKYRLYLENSSHFRNNSDLDEISHKCTYAVTIFCKWLHTKH